MPRSPDPLIVIEVCVDSLESATAAVEGGASRLEICSNLGIGGGTTPSFGLINVIKRRHADVPLMAMIRPRVGDFVYSQEEMETMVADIQAFRQVGVTGVVFGVLTPDGLVDKVKLKILLEAAGSLEVCFHRAFDMTRDPIEAFNMLNGFNQITRILTSGLQPTVASDSAIRVLSDLFRIKEQVGSSIQIMPGSGINAGTLRTIINACSPWLGSINRPIQIHLSGGRWVKGNMIYQREEMGMGIPDHEWELWKTVREAIARVHGESFEALT